MIMYYCLAIAMLLPIILALSSIPLRFKQFAEPDINEPRAQAEEFTGAGRRLVAAQKNAWEALALFTASLFIAYANNVESAQIAMTCMVFIAARISHAILYVANWGKLRFVSFLVAFGAIANIVKISIF